MFFALKEDYVCAEEIFFQKHSAYFLLMQFHLIHFCYRVVELALPPSQQAPPDPIPYSQLQAPTSIPISLMSQAKSARSLANNSFVSIQSVHPPLSEAGGSIRRIRSPTNWSLHISPLSRDGRSESQW